MSELTPREIVNELDRYIIGQNAAKRAVAIALRNRWRRMQLDPALRDEVTPKNILMIGPTGVGKTEIARRLAALANAPFIKVEATKFTEVGYVGKDVEQIVRDLADSAVKMAREQAKSRVRSQAEDRAEDRILDALLPRRQGVGFANEPQTPDARDADTRQKLRKQLREGALDDREIELDIAQNLGVEIMAPPGMEEMTSQLRGMFQSLAGQRTHKRKLSIAQARPLLEEEEAGNLVNDEEIKTRAITNCEQNGIVKTDHILFIASGAFSLAKPSDLVPELQGRFPIRVELAALSADDFRRILSEPQSALTKQYTALLATEGVTLEFADDGIARLAEIAFQVNERTENIGARRLHTVLERLLDEISFEAADKGGQHYRIDAAYVDAHLATLVKDEDLSRYIL